jgi:hypothetical protein
VVLPAQRTPETAAILLTLKKRHAYRAWLKKRRTATEPQAGFPMSKGDNDSGTFLALLRDKRHEALLFFGGPVILSDIRV